MTDTIKEYEGNASTVRFAAPTPYLLASHIRVYVGEPLVETTDFTVDTVTSEVVLTTPPPAPSAPGIKNVRVQRDTPSQPLVDFQSPGAILKADLNTATKQFLYQIEEWEDQFEQDAILDESITQAKLAKPSVDTPELVDLGVTTAKLDDDAVTVGKLAEQAAYTVLANDTAGVANPSHRRIDDLTVLADGSTTRRDLSARAAEEVNVRDYGAVGDGVTDDSAAIAAAFAACQAAGGGVINFPFADYRFYLNITGNTKRIIFRGNNSTFRPLASATNDTIIYCNNYASGFVSSFLTVQDVLFTGRFSGSVTAGDAGYGVRFEGVSGGFFERCTFAFFAVAGVYGKYTQYCHFTDCTFGSNADTNAHGVFLESPASDEESNENKFFRCLFLSNKTGMLISGGNMTRIIGCQFQGHFNGGTGALVLRQDPVGTGSPRQTLIEGCYFEFNDSRDISIGTAENVTIIGCIFTNSNADPETPNKTHSVYSTSLYAFTMIGNKFLTADGPTFASTHDQARLTYLGNNKPADTSSVSGNFPAWIVEDQTSGAATVDYQFMRHKMSGYFGAIGLQLGDYRLWVDSSGRLRIKNSDPSSDTDGTIVGTQT